MLNIIVHFFLREWYSCSIIISQRNGFILFLEYFMEISSMYLTLLRVMRFQSNLLKYLSNIFHTKSISEKNSFVSITFICTPKFGMLSNFSLGPHSLLFSHSSRSRPSPSKSPSSSCPLRKLAKGQIFHHRCSRPCQQAT